MSSLPAKTDASPWDRAITAARARCADFLTSPDAVERLARIAGSEAVKNTKLRECSPVSIVSSLMLAAQLNLEPSSALGHAYLIPRRQECTLLIGYKGLLELARRSGDIRSIAANVVYQDEVDLGLFHASYAPADVEHRFSVQNIDRRDQNIVAAYAVCELASGGTQIAILTRQDIEARRRKSGGNGGPWKTDYAAMARKSAIRALLNGGTVPMSSQLRAAVTVENERELSPDPVTVDAEHLPPSGGMAGLRDRLLTDDRPPTDEAPSPDPEPHDDDGAPPSGAWD